MPGEDADNPPAPEEATGIHLWCCAGLKGPVGLYETFARVSNIFTFLSCKTTFI